MYLASIIRLVLSYRFLFRRIYILIANIAGDNPGTRLTPFLSEYRCRLKFLANYLSRYIVKCLCSWIGEQVCASEVRPGFMPEHTNIMTII
jgi:hypothetical protein